MTNAFDPNAAAAPGSGVFGLPHTRRESRIALLPVPFDATTSYGGGAAGGPDGVREASHQVDLFDHHFGRIYEGGIFMEDSDASIRRLSEEARAIAQPIIEKGGADPHDADDIDAVGRVDEACEDVNQGVYEWTTEQLDKGRIPGVIGGDHSTPFGAIKACAEWAASERGEMGVLQIDAHMDLRESYEGFRWSHASIMHNVLNQVEGVARLVQVGIRDYCEAELEFARASDGLVVTHFDADWHLRRDDGESFSALCLRLIDDLPAHVYISFDIDGLSPELCPGTGTPTPGGLSFNEAARLLLLLKQSGRRIIGFDLNEVSPQPDDREWNANVGARVLYKLCGCAMR